MDMEDCLSMIDFTLSIGIVSNTQAMLKPHKIVPNQNAKTIPNFSVRAGERMLFTTEPSLDIDRLIPNAKANSRPDADLSINNIKNRINKNL
jgi:hypothetical protein